MEKKAMRVFLGGTCNNSTWRNDLEPMLEIESFNPVVDDWNEESQKQELYERANCDLVLYTITHESDSVYSIAEVVDDSNKQPDKTVMCILPDGFDKVKLKHLCAVGKCVKLNGGKIFYSLKETACYLNNYKI